MRIKYILTLLVLDQVVVYMLDTHRYSQVLIDTHSPYTGSGCGAGGSSGDTRISSSPCNETKTIQRMRKSEQQTRDTVVPAFKVLPAVPWNFLGVLNCGIFALYRQTRALITIEAARLSTQLPML